jgi:hypothetical protein
MVLGTGLVERVFWWRLIARGYGLISPKSDGSLRRRPAWEALRTLIAQVEGATFEGPLPAPEGAYLYHFTRGGDRLVVAWSTSTGVQAQLPAPAAEAVSRDGRRLPPRDGVEIDLGPSPAYYRIR